MNISSWKMCVLLRLRRTSPEHRWITMHLPFAILQTWKVLFGLQRLFLLSKERG
nr:MAG TPA: hypothetical protein [Caudoviricetes sp.]